MTKEQLIEEYLALSNMGPETVRAMIQPFIDQLEFVPDAPSAERVEKYMNSVVKIATDLTRGFMAEHYDVEELRYMVENQKHPVTQKQQRLVPVVIALMQEKMEGMLTQLAEALEEPEKLDEIMPN